MNRCRVSNNPPIHQFSSLQGHGLDAALGLGTADDEFQLIGPTNNLRYLDGSSVGGAPGYGAKATAVISGGIVVRIEVDPLARGIGYESNTLTEVHITAVRQPTVYDAAAPHEGVYIDKGAFTYDSQTSHYDHALPNGTDGGEPPPRTETRTETRTEAWTETWTETRWSARTLARLRRAAGPGRARHLPERVGGGRPPVRDGVVPRRRPVGAFEERVRAVPQERSDRRRRASRGGVVRGRSRGGVGGVRIRPDGGRRERVHRLRVAAARGVVKRRRAAHVARTRVRARGGEAGDDVGVALRGGVVRGSGAVVVARVRVESARFEHRLHARQSPRLRGEVEGSRARQRVARTRETAGIARLGGRRVGQVRKEGGEWSDGR